MAALPLPFHSYRLRSTPASTARLVNCVPQKLPPDAPNPLVLNRVAGPKSFVDVGTGPIRGQHTFQGNLHVVSGTTLYKIELDGTVTGYFVSIAGTGSVSMDHNVGFMVIVAEPNAYVFDGGGVSQITDVDFTSRGAKYVRFLDNYMVFMQPGTGILFWADVGSATSFDSLNFVTAEAAPDNNVGIESDHQQLIALGEDSGQILQFTGDGLEAAVNGFFALGCLNGDTIAKSDNSTMWVASDFTVRRLTGATPQRISNAGVEIFLSSVDVTTLRAYAYDQDGHFFYLLCCSDGCFTYDSAAGEWAERKTYPEEYFRWQYHAAAHGRHYVGDFYSGEVAYFDPLTFTDGGDIQRMEWTYQPIRGENRRAKHKSLEVVLESGTGLVTGQGSDPEIMMAYSDDGGRTWTNLPNRKIGRIGEYTHRVRWTALGSSRNRVYRGAISDPVKVSITDTQIDVEGGRI